MPYKDKEKAREAGRRYAIKFRDSARERLRLWRKRFPEKAALARRRQRLRKLYNMSLNDYQVMLSKQGGACAICSETVDLFVDHNHQTGKVRGLLCGICNGALNRVENVQGWAIKALRYLEQE